MEGRSVRSLPFGSIIPQWQIYLKQTLAHSSPPAGQRDVTPAQPGERTDQARGGESGRGERKRCAVGCPKLHISPSLPPSLSLSRSQCRGAKVGRRAGEGGRMRVAWGGRVAREAGSGRASLLLSVFTSLSRFEYVNRVRCIVTANA